MSEENCDCDELDCEECNRRKENWLIDKEEGDFYRDIGKKEDYEYKQSLEGGDSK